MLNNFIKKNKLDIGVIIAAAYLKVAAIILSRKVMKGQ